MVLVGVLEECKAACGGCGRWGGVCVFVAGLSVVCGERAGASTGTHRKYKQAEAN